MSVQRHRVILCLLGFVLFLAMFPILNGYQALMESNPSGNGLEEVAGDSLLGWILGFARLGGFIAIFVGWGILIDFLLIRVYPALVPAYCQRPGCRGRMHLLRGPESYDYICERCRLHLDTGFRLGGDD